MNRSLRLPRLHLVASLLLPALAVPLGAGCGDDVAGVMSADGTGGGGVGSGTGPGASGTTSGAGPGSVSAAGTTGSGYGEGGDWGGSGGGSGDDGDEPPPSLPPPEEEPEEVTCDDLDATQPLVLYVSADDSNSMASPAEAREALRGGSAPWSIRTYEFLNYYDVSLPAPAYPDVGLFAQGEAGDVEGTIDLMLGVRAHDAQAARRPSTITFVVDTSGSMQGTPIQRAKATVKAIAGQLREGDIVNVVTWNTENLVELTGHVITGPEDERVIEVADALGASGGTNLNGGLEVGYELAREHYATNRLNRVVLISDGGANVGVTQADLIGTQSEDADGEGIYMVGVGVGPLEGYSDELMDVVTDAGRGAYVYVDSVEEAERIFGQRFDETMDIAARAVQVEVTLPWYFQMKKFYGEEYSENPEEVDPQHLAPGDATVILQTLKACSPDVIDPADPVRLRATWQTPLAREDREAIIETTIGALLDGDTTHLQEAEAIVAYAEALKTSAPADLEAALAKVQALSDRQDPDLMEIEELLLAHPLMGN
jgi:Ca-activated chloride channel family protein